MASNPPSERSRSSFLSVPAPIRRLFDKFPLVTYPENALPASRPNLHDHVLYVFGDGPVSFNPACLKWQAYLKFSQVPFRSVSSNNHASPSGALPFLLPVSADSKLAKPIPSGRLQRWIMDKSSSAIEESPDGRYEAYLSLIDHRIRRAWLYSVYLSANSTSIAEPLYILTSSRNSFVRLAIARELSHAAEKELLKFSAVIDSRSLYSQAEEAFDALETVLGKHTWFFGNESPALFDASVFAYTHLLLDDRLGKGWMDTRLRDTLLKKKRLVAHRNKILEIYFQEA
ncbi:hypothetical protein B0J11DRAFT_541530 [Dendryphion nanum]|uniref:Mitochondrial outer membrane protein n=1 Tax=Dendryphion nanum TaxID=256645 RepID=A0A9P9IBI7_9PLEO|nr:hypothetical protein B0J11DRAFT_541530 [Dendryphion nanum]